MNEVAISELMSIEGGAGGWVSFLVGAGTAVGCLASGGGALGPIGWAGCGAAGLLVGVGTYIL